MGLVTIDEAKEIAGTFNGQTLTSMTDAQIQLKIDSATTRIERYCRRHFEEGTYTETYYDGDNFQNMIFLSNFPVSEVSEINIYETDGSYTQYLAGSGNCPDGFELRPELGQLIALDYYFTQKVEVTYIGGYSTGSGGTIPADLKEACVQLMILSLDPKLGTMAAESLGDYSYRLGDEKNQILPLAIKQMVGSYKSIKV